MTTNSKNRPCEFTYHMSRFKYRKVMCSKCQVLPETEKWQWTNKDKLCRADHSQHIVYSSEMQIYLFAIFFWSPQKVPRQIGEQCTRCHISATGSRQIGTAVAQLFRQPLVDWDKYPVFSPRFPFSTCSTAFSHNLSHFLVRARLFINLMSPAHASDGPQTTLPS